jgi:gliding motility-associated-like protein
LNQIFILKKLLLLFILSIFSLSTYATHLIGGEMTYNCLGDNLYEITLIMYVDCGPSNTTGTTFDATGILSIYNSSNQLVESITISEPEEIELSDETVGNDCLELPADLCILRGVYTVVVELPPIVGGYQLAYQRCCRNPSIINIVTPDLFGNTYTTNIPGSELVSDCNSSPSFEDYPPLALCLGDDINVNLSATDPDNDSLVYSLTTPIHGADNLNPMLITPPPFSTIPWATGYSASYPIDSSPAIVIDANSGYITGTPTQMGMYIVGVLVDEYREGVLINSIVRDFRFMVVDCNIITASSPLSDWICNGLTVNFTNSSVNAVTYLWDLGVGSATSTDFEPNYAYPDTGNYTVTLIANPNTVCADTNTVSFSLYTELNPIFTTPEPQCLANNSFSFEGDGLIPSGSYVNWEFGLSASPTNSDELNPSNISFPAIGTYPVSFNVQYEECDETYTANVVIFKEDIFPVIPNLDSQCLDGNAFNFSALGTYPTGSAFEWNFGSNASPQYSSDQNPSSITFSTLGEQSITLNVLYNGCENAVQSTVETLDHINVEIQSSPTEGCEPFTVEFENLLPSSDFAFNWDLDNGITSTSPNPQNTYMEGVFNISLTIIDLNTLCEGNLYLDNYITVLPQPISGFSISSDSLIYGEDIVITNSALNANTYLYEFSSGKISTEEEPTYIIPSIGDFTIWQFASNEFDCIDSTSLDLNIVFYHTFWVPNVFTPNGNATNDYFFPIYTNVESYRMQIFDRWGKIVYDKEGVQPKWDGLDYLSGIESKSDNYVYLINYYTIEEITYQVKGVVTLIR